MEKHKFFIRDKRSPIPKNESVSRIMSANRAKNTKPEIALRKALTKAGLRGYRLNYKKIPGRPDIVFVSKKVAIFVHGCFWHRCPHCNYALPKHNKRFWENKFSKNVTRDKEKIKQLKKMNWRVITVWECRLKKNKLDRTLNSIINKIYS